MGVFVAVETLEDLPAVFSAVLQKVPECAPGERDAKSDAPHENAVHIVLLRGTGAASDDECAEGLTKFLSGHTADLKARSVRRVSFVVGPSAADRQHSSKAHPAAAGIIYTFRGKKDFAEDRLFRHIEAPHAFHLDLPRLANFSLSLETGVQVSSRILLCAPCVYLDLGVCKCVCPHFQQPPPLHITPTPTLHPNLPLPLPLPPPHYAQTTSGNVHLYKAVPRSGKGPRRYFARLVSFTSDVKSRCVN